MKTRVKEVGLLYASVAIGIFLGVLFVVESLIPEKQITIYGFIVAFITLIICILLYNILPLKIKLKMNNKKIRIKKMNPWQIAIVVGLFEGVILTVMAIIKPLMRPFYILSMPIELSKPIGALIFGLIAGFIGALIAIMIYNLIIKKTKGLSIELEK